MNIAIITAAGTGSRMNQSTPKQFMDINGKPLIVYTLEKFDQSDLIDEIAISCLDGWQDTIKELIKKYSISKVKHIVTGGKTGQESITNAYNAIKDKCDDNSNIVIHDGNRPNLSQELIKNSIELCEKKGNAILYIPCQEVMFISDDFISSTEQIDRSRLARTQTPHVFKKHLLDKLFSLAEKNSLYSEVAICSLCQKVGETIYLCKGDEKNIKITFQSDIDIFKALLKSNA